MGRTGSRHQRSDGEGAHYRDPVEAGGEQPHPGGAAGSQAGCRSAGGGFGESLIRLARAALRKGIGNQGAQVHDA